jgi:hypothetical protein
MTAVADQVYPRTESNLTNISDLKCFRKFLIASALTRDNTSAKVSSVPGCQAANRDRLEALIDDTGRAQPTLRPDARGPVLLAKACLILASDLQT